MSKKKQLQAEFEENLELYIKKLEELSLLQDELFQKAVKESQTNSLAQARSKLKDLI